VPVPRKGEKNGTDFVYSFTGENKGERKEKPRQASSWQTSFLLFSIGFECKTTD
jgi:hypothetical protein